jgi:hypothetical protein
MRALAMANQLKLDKEETITQLDLLPEQRERLLALRVVLMHKLHDFRRQSIKVHQQDT